MRSIRRSHYVTFALVPLTLLVATSVYTPSAAADSTTVLASFPGGASWTQSTGAFDGSNYWSFGGCSTGTSIMKYVVGSNTATLQSGTLPQGRAYATSQYAGGNVYIFGGEVGATPCSGGSKTNSILKYTPGGSVTTLGATLPTARELMASVYDGSRYIYVFGGSDASDALTDIVQFDTATQTSTLLGTHLPWKFYGGSAAWDGTSAYIVGLHNYNQPYIVKYTPGGSATVIGSLPLAGSFPNYYQVSAYTGGFVYVLGGVSSGDPRHIQRVTPSTGAVTTMPGTLPGDAYQQSQSGFATGGFVYYQGLSGNVATMMKYDPTTPPPGQAVIYSSPSYGRTGTSYSFSATTGASGLDYGWDWNNDGTVDEWVSGNTVSHTFSSDATYVVHARARDVLQQLGSWSSPWNTVIDSVNPSSPSVQSSTHPVQSNWYSNNAPSLSWTQSDPSPSSGLQGSRWALDASTSGGYTSQTSTSYSSLADGTHTFNVDVADNAGNVQSGSFTLRVDKTAPTSAAPQITSGTSGSNGWYTTNVGLAISSADALTASPCEQHSTSSSGPWDGGSCTTADAWTDASEGSRTWYGYARDLAGNTRAGQDTLGMKIDKTAPTIADNQADVSWTNANPSLDVDFGDATSGLSNVEYTLWSAAGQTGTQLKAWTSLFSSSSDGTGSYTQNWPVDSAALAQGNNYVSVRVTDRAGFQTSANDVARIQWDSQSPSRATPTITGGTLGTNGWYKSDVGMNIDAADATSGVATMWHSATSSAGPWSGGSATDAWTDTTEGTVTWYGRAIDLAGNAFVSTGVPVKIDKTSPTSQLTPSGTAGLAGWYTSNVQETLTGADATSGPSSLRYKVDSGSWSTLPGSSTTFPVTGEGAHAVSYYATDAAGNSDGSDASPHTASLSIDTAAPSSSASITAGTLGSNGWYTSAVTVAISSTDATSGPGTISYSLDGGSWQTTSANPASVGITTSGTHTLSYYATDVAGNSDGSTSSPHTMTVKVDRAAPASTLSTQGTTGQNGWFVSAVTVTIGATDDASGVASTAYGVNDASTPLSYTGAFNVNQQGTVTIYASSRDNAGLVEAPPASRVVKVDTAAPALTGWSQSPPNVDASQTGPVNVLVSVDGGPSGVASAQLRWSYDSGATWSAYAPLSPAGGSLYSGSIPEPANGWWFYKTQSLEYDVQAADGAGNSVTSGTMTDTIDRVSPTVVLLSPASYTNWGAGTRTVQFTGRDADHDAVTYRVWISSDNGATYPSSICTTTVTETGATSSYSCSVDTTQYSDSATYAFKVTATDGLFTVQQSSHDVTMENRKPTVALITPQEGSICTLSTCATNPLGETVVVGIVTLQASASDIGVSTGIERVEFYIDGALLATSTTPASTGFYQASWNTIGMIGQHTVSVISYDNAGNASNPQTRTVAVIAHV